MPDHELLPPEIWLEIFHWVATSSKDYNLHTTEYVPFHLTPLETRDSHNLNEKRALLLVCRKWYNLSARLLYRDIRIRHGAKALKQVLEGAGQESDCYGDLVRRVVLPYSSTVTGPTTAQTLPISIEILKHCRQLETLVRPRHLPPEGLRFEFDAEILPMPCLRRLEWWHHQEAERSGGVNSLGVVLGNAPNLQYLFIGGVVGLTNIGMQPVCLPSLQTLRLHVINGLLLRQIVFQWSLPSLSNMILDSPLVEQGLGGVWDVFGSQLRRVEFGRHLRFLMADNLAPCLRGCPKLEEINYYVLFTASPEMTQPHESITTVGLNCAANQFLVEAGGVWGLIERHFDFLSGNMLPNLRRIVLYGSWKGILGHPRFAPLMTRLGSRAQLLTQPDEIEKTWY